MYSQTAINQYKAMQAKGLKRAKELERAGKDPKLPVLEHILGEDAAAYKVQEIGTQEIPLSRVVGVRTEGRASAFTEGFLPLLNQDSEFGFKWIDLCDVHLNEGIRDAVLVYEYLGNFYVEEGNKRVSVLKSYGATYVMAKIRRVLPQPSEDPEIKLYEKFLEFFKVAGFYDLWFKEPGMYAKLLAKLPFSADQEWDEEQRRTFQAGYHYFADAFRSMNIERDNIGPEDAFLLWLDVYPFEELTQMTSEELRKSIGSLWDDVVASNQPAESVAEVVPETEQKGFISSLLFPDRRHVNVAFVHQRDPEKSIWTKAHDEGREEMEKALGERVTVRSYFNADDPAGAEKLIEEAVNDGAEIVFTTAPPLIKRTLAVAVHHPEVLFFNCAPDLNYSSVFGYYFRAYEGKFISGAIAGALAEDGRIGYIAPYPILGSIAEINAFALGALMTNPHAKVYLRWSAMHGQHVEDLLQQGIRVISSRDIPVQEEEFLRYGEYGLYLANDQGGMTPLCSPLWVWGTFYESVVKAYLSNTRFDRNGSSVATNFYLGMDAGAIDVIFSEDLPEGVRFLAEQLRENLRQRKLGIFKRRITAQDGTVMSDGSREFSFEDLLHMDWLCDNVEGHIPQYDEIRPISQKLVRLIGIYRDQIPPETGGTE